MAHANPTAGQSAVELKAQIKVEAAGTPFVVWREPAGEQFVLPLTAERLTIGRGDEVDVDLEGDDQVSRVHAELERVGEAWVIADDGLSTNGTFVNGERVGARRRLTNKDLIGIGDSGLLFRDPRAEGDDGPGPTRAAQGTSAARELTDAQRNVLIALCRPFAGGESFASAATNRQIAEEVFLSIDAVKGHLRVLFEKFELGDLPQNRKRVKLAEQALQTGAVRPSDFG
ncbi:MAG: FHA domain-containing protein [Solirubrobacterales bacterium]|nr:MAG: FHA domain-containing protein [Solirubrobacterales bacterium]